MIRINHIRLRALTPHRTFGSDLPLTTGLNVIRADNTSGKSTCLLAIVYGLGFERSLGPNPTVPLPYAMRTRILLRKDSPEYEPVIQSYVMLEIQNHHGDVVTLRRDIVGGSDPKLIQTWPGRRLNGPDPEAPQHDYFVHDPGAAMREAGFHAFLSRFLGWQLPEVPRFDGSESPLYLETLWPLFFVEQKRGWSVVQGPFPTFFRIQDLPRRVMEYVLALEVAEFRRRQAELRKEIARLEQRWNDRKGDILSRTRRQVRVSGLPNRPTVEFARAPDGVHVLVFHQDSWITIADLESRIQRRRDAIDAVDLPDAEHAEAELHARLKTKEDEYAKLTADSSILRHDYHSAESERKSLEARIDSLSRDLQRNQDTKKLQRLGSSLAGVIVDNSCPTCHQPLEGELLPEPTFRAMGIEENIEFIRSQIALYSSIRLNTDENLETLRVRHESVQAELSDVRAAIRGLRDDLIRPSTAVVRSEIEELVRLEGRLDHWQSVQETIDESLDEMRELANEWGLLRSEYDGLGSGELSGDDRKKIARLNAIIRELLDTFGFESFRTDEIALADDDFRPRVIGRDEEGDRIEKNIGFEASASDGIRLKWAYSLALVKLSQETKIHHPGVLVFDEPGQQQMKGVDLSNFLDWAARNAGSQCQIIVSTSEEEAQVRESLEGTNANVLSHQGFLIDVLQ